MEEIVGRTLIPRWARWLAGFVLVAAAGTALLTRDIPIIALLLCMTMSTVNLMRGPVRVAQDGVRIPRLARRARRIGWGTVESIAIPGRFDAVAMLLLSDGRDVPLHGISAAQAPAAAALGGVPVRNRPPIIDDARQ
jgi:hypothetical protein